MTALVPKDFSAFFTAVHGYEPFPWQARLAKRVVEMGRWPNLINLPTAAGKTATIDIAVFHLACEAECGPSRRAALRILFVIDRRIVVDAATERALKIVKALHQSPNKVVAEVARRLSLLSDDKEHPLDVVRLRGGARRNATGRARRRNRSLWFPRWIRLAHGCYSADTAYRRECGQCMPVWSAPMRCGFSMRFTFRNRSNRRSMLSKKATRTATVAAFSPRRTALRRFQWCGCPWRWPNDIWMCRG